MSGTAHGRRCGIRSAGHGAGIRFLRRGAPRVHLGIMYLEGTGVEKDEEKAFALFKAAAERGNRDAKLIVNKWDGRIERRKAKKS